MADEKRQSGRSGEEGDGVSGISAGDENTMDWTSAEPASQDKPSDVSDQEKTPEVIHCYCGKPRSRETVELQCGGCMKFFHSECISCFLGKCVPFMTNYQFFCKGCNSSGLESFNKKQASFSQMCQTAVANLIQQSPDKSIYFSKERDIIPYIDLNWESLTPVPRRVKMTWHATISKSMMKETKIFKGQEGEDGEILFSLVNQDLGQIGPNYEGFFKAAEAVLKSGEYKIGGFSSDISSMSNTTNKSRGAKRKAPDSTILSNSRQKRGDVIASHKLAPHGYPAEHPFNKDGYRYILAEPDPHAPNRQAFDDSIEWAGKPIPGYLYRTFLSSQVLFALHDRAPQLKISEDRLSVTGEKGYSMVRATHGVNHGNWYYEVTVTEMPPDTATRLGWAQKLGNLQAPCGYDKFSYSWRSRKGTRFHHSHGKHYSEEYGKGDTLGFYISLPKPNDPGQVVPISSKDKPLVKFKSHLYFEEKDYTAEAEKTLVPNKGSKIVLYLNGQNQGTAWEDIYKGFYYPAVSLYKNAAVSINFGPDFKYPPKDLRNYKPMSEASFDAVVQNALGDILYHVEHEGQLPEF